MLKLFSNAILACLFLVASVNVQSSPLVSGKQSMFIKQMLPQVRKANGEVQVKRERLESIHAKWSKSHSLSFQDKAWVDSLAVEYKLKDFSTKDKAGWDKLLHRVDVLPESLILAQAIHESDWGQSRIAKQVNNYFGRFCFTSGCGIQPQKRRSKSDKHEIKAFSSAYASVGDYIRNINTHQAYQNLRAERSELHKKNKDLHGSALVPHLLKYSEDGVSYVRMVKAIINAYKLEKLDTV
jgi:Bax protein